MTRPTFDSLRLCALCALLAALAACGKQASTDAAATASSAQGATVAELLGSSQQPASANPPSAAPNQTALNEPAAMPQGADADYARVISVTPVTGPRQVCTDETVTEQRRPEDEHQVAGTVVGAVAGGVIGHQFGGGRGRTLATVGGAVGGGLVGKQVQKNHQSKDTVSRVVKRCRTVDDASAAPVYDVVYAYQGQNLHVRLDHDPGDRLALPVRGIVNE